MSKYNPYKRKSHAKVIVVSAILAFLGLLVYDNIAYPVSAASPLTSNEKTSVIDKNAMAVLDKIDRIKLDPTVFQSKAFRSLQDITVLPSPQEAGRSNPFAPVPGIPSLSTTKTPTGR